MPAAVAVVVVVSCSRATTTCASDSCCDSLVGAPREKAVGGRGRPVLERAALYEIAFVVTSHVAFVAVLLGLIAGRGITVPGLTVTAQTWALLPFGAGLGLAQMVTSIFLCQVIIVGMGVVASRRRFGWSVPPLPPPLSRHRLGLTTAERAGCGTTWWRAAQCGDGCRCR